MNLDFFHLVYTKKLGAQYSSLLGLVSRRLSWCSFARIIYGCEREMATHSSILAWRIPWTEEPSRLQSEGSRESETT